MLLKTSEIRELIRLLDETSVHELHIELEDGKIHIKKADTLSYAPPLSHVDVPVAAPAAVPAPVVSEVTTSVTPTFTPPAESSAAAAEEGTVLIKSPMVGTFYAAPSPTSPPYVEVGSKVTEKTVVCIVEAMKLMNEIEADVRGEIVEVIAENGHLVEYGQPLFRVKLA